MPRDWVVERVTRLVPQLPVRDLASLRAQHDGLTGDALAAALVTAAGRATAAIGAAGGGLAAAEFAAPPTLLTAPFQLTAETLAVVAVELRLVAELHEVYGVPVQGPPAVRAAAYLGSWVRQRGIEQFAGGGRAGLLGGAASRQVRKRVVRRLARSGATMAPLLVGAAAGAALNRRETHRLGDRLVADLRSRSAR